MSHNNDNYIKPRSTRARLHLPATEEANQIEPVLRLTDDEALDAAIYLHDLDWSVGRTRDELRQVYLNLPLAIYLRLPDSKRFTSAGEVLHEVGLAASRAEGDFMGARPDYPAEESVDDGGPPGWGTDESELEGTLSIDGGSSEDRITGPEPASE
ncbi:MAG: hypothetical protein ACLQUY_02595 [Ktedonobacterales bacterium]